MNRPKESPHLLRVPLIHSLAVSSILAFFHCCQLC